MNKFIQVITLIIIEIGMILMAGIIIGFIVRLLYSAVIPAIMPGLVSLGIIAGNISLWKSILLCWLCFFLFKSNISSKSD